MINLWLKSWSLALLTNFSMKKTRLTQDTGIVKMTIFTVNKK